MRRFSISVFVLLLGIAAFSSCEKVLNVNLPEGVSGIVFEGQIENGKFPYLIISRSESYFSPINTATEAIVNSLVTADSVFITVDGTRYEMDQICVNDLTPEQRQQALEALGIDSLPTSLNLCVYAKFSLIGELGKTYALKAYVEGKEYNASTTIEHQVYLDSLWYKDELPVDSFGSIWVQLSDPAATTDYYFMWSENFTQGRSMYPVDGGPSFSDRLFNGESIQFNIYQGSNLANDNGSGEDTGLFEQGDTVVVKLGTIDQGVYNFWESVDAASNLNPFSSPTPVFSNFDNGGRGVWAGYATTVDTFICVKY
ncbi:MAG: DUF4249 family protein [Flavobacteriales bacterium]|nr:DUF4249 family protein [Flavobacteriales bacterium]